MDIMLSELEEQLIMVSDKDRLKIDSLQSGRVLNLLHL